MNMKRISIFLFAAAALWWGGCEDSSDTDREIPVSVVVLDASLSGGIVLEAGQTQNIAGKVSFLPENATDTAETYESSDSEIASVDESGLLRALQQGSAMITITVGGKHAHFGVEVEAQRIPVESVTLPEDLTNGVSLHIGETLEIAGRAIITPENATETETTYASSDETVATVGADGVVTAVAEGTATITVTVGGQSASFELTVTKIVVEGITLPEDLTNGVTRQIGETLEIAGRAIITPENATVIETTYASSDTNVATVSDEGVVTALKEGTATITVTVDGHSASFELTVTKVPVASVTLPKDLTDGVSLKPNQTLNIAGKATVLPENATYKAEIYASLNESVATVDADGVVTAVAEGTAKITVTVDGVEASFELTVAADVPPVPVALEKIEISKQTATLELSPGATFELAPLLTFTPAEQNEGVVYTSYDSDIATVDENGTITCLKVGTATITALAKDDDADGKRYKNKSRRVIFSLAITDPHDLNRTGWKMYDWSQNKKLVGKNASDTAPFDNVFDPSFYPTNTDAGTNFGVNRPGKNGVALDAKPYFVVDMQEVREVNYFRLKHQSCRKADRGCRWLKFIEILGTDTPLIENSWVSIATDVDFKDSAWASYQGTNPDDGGSLELAKYRDTPNIKFNKVKYRYLKFVSDKTCFDGTNGTAQIAELYLGLDE